ADGQALQLSGSCWPTFFTGLMSLLTVLSLNVLSEGLTDALASPRVTTNADVASDEKSMARPCDEDAAVEAGAAGPVPDADPGRPELDGEAVLGATDEETAPRLLMESLTRLRVRESERGDRRVVEAQPLLEVEDLRAALSAAHRAIDIVAGAPFRVRPGEPIGLVGE